MMRAEVATLGLAQDRCGGQSETVAASESVYVIVAVVVELYNASVAAAAAVVVVAAVAAAVVACAVSILFPADLSARSLLCHVHPARTWARRDARFQSLASSH
jgi:hypothetical protein